MFSISLIFGISLCFLRHAVFQVKVIMKRLSLAVLDFRVFWQCCAESACLIQVVTFCTATPELEPTVIAARTLFLLD
jgi:hypothetical protein